MRLLLAMIIAAAATGCATVPYEEACQAPDWVEVVHIRQQELARARAAVNESCKRSSHLSILVEKKLAKLISNLAEKNMAKKLLDPRQAIDSKNQTIALADQAYAECLRAQETWKEEEGRYKQLGRILESRAAPSIDVDVYHHYY